MSEKQEETKILKEVIEQLIAGLSSAARDQVASFSITMNINPSDDVKIRRESSECMHYQCPPKNVCMCYSGPDRLGGEYSKSTCSNVCLEVTPPFECNSVCKPFSYYDECRTYGCLGLYGPCKMLDNSAIGNREIQEKIKSDLRGFLLTPGLAIRASQIRYA